jgi:uncharacterized repeat protein (TIGR01451 family)
MNRWTRRLVLFATCAFLLVFAASAFGDAADVKIPPTQSPTIDANATLNPDGTVTVTVTGGWSWPTHGKDCNTDRAGTGVAIDWFDPKDPGNALGASVTINGVSTPIFVGTSTDNVVHPTENDTGTGNVADVSSPSQFASWRGGCGVFSADQVLNSTVQNVAHGNFGQASPGMTGYTNPTPPLLPSQQGALLTHTYASVDDVKQVCAVTYDVHGGTNANKNNGVGIPGSAKEITAGGTGHNGDNGVEDNGNTPTGNACPAIVFPKPKITTTAGGAGPIGSNGQTTLSDTAHLSGGTATAGGTIDFKLYKDDGSGGCGTQIGASTVNVTTGADNDDYGSGTPSSGSFTVSAAGTYHWVASYSGDGKNLPAAGKCGDSNENPVVTPLQPTVKTTAAASVSIGANGTVAIHDSATLSDGTSNAGGSLTFRLYNNSDCAPAHLEATATPATTVNGANGVSYDSADVTVSSAGTYYWSVEYSGDSPNNNAIAETPCGLTSNGNQEVTVVKPLEPTVATTLTSDHIAVGDKGSDSAQISGATSNAGGTITYNVYDNANCTGTPVFTSGPLTVTNGVAPGSGNLGPFTSPGTYQWQAEYTGDTNNKPAESACGTEAMAVVGLAIDKKADAASVETGSQVGFTVTVTGSGPAKGVTLNDPLPSGPSGNTLNWSIPSGGVTGDVTPSCSISGAAGSQTLHCDGVDLGAGTHGEVAQSYKVHIVSATSASGPGFMMTNTATASAANDGTVKASDSVDVVALAIEKHADVNQVATGTPIGYSITVTGSGPAKAVTLDDPLPAGPAGNELNWSIVSVTGDVVPSCAISGAPQSQTLDCTAVDLGTGADGSTPQSYTVHITSPTNPNGPGFTIKNDATASASNHHPVTDDDTTAGDTTPLGPGTGNTIEVGAQLVAPTRVTPGAARLVGPTGCVAKVFSARIKGTKVQSVRFVLDGKTIKRFTKPVSSGLYAVRIDPRKMRLGVHRLVVNVTFQKGTGTKPKTLRLSFQRCAKKLAIPRFTG